jgi:hypothetical protein
LKVNRLVIGGRGKVVNLGASTANAAKLQHYD